jgi:hypothetical protein
MLQNPLKLLPKISCTVLTTLLLSALVYAQLGNLFSIQTQAESYSAVESPEAYLTISGKTNDQNSFESFTNLNDLSKLPNQTDYVISGLSVEIKEVLNNESLFLNCDLEIPKSISETKKDCSLNFANQLQALQNLKSKNPSETKDLKPVLNQTNETKLKETKKDVENQNGILSIFSKNKAKINFISLQGKATRVEAIRKQFSKDYPKTQIQYFTTQNIQDQKNQLDKQIQDKVTKEKKTKEQATNEIIQQKIDEEVAKLPKEQQNKIKELKTTTPITQDTIQKIDSIKTVDSNNANVSIDTNKLAKLNLTKDQQEAVKKAITNYNTQPVAIKTNLNNTLKEEAKKVGTNDNKVVSALKGLVNGVEAEAGGCRRSASISWYWWGQRLYVNSCLINDVKFFGQLIVGAVGLAALTPCSWACGVFAFIIGTYVGWLEWANGRCDNRGAYAYRSSSGGSPWVGNVC